MHFAVVDIGSPSRGNLGWWVSGHDIDAGGTDTDDMIAALSEAVKAGPLVLGFEAPMYVPAKRDLHSSLKARPGEGSRPWSVAAGATTTAIALAIVPAILDRLAIAVPGIQAWQDWTKRPSGPKEMLVFEAFVSGGPSNGHAADAMLAVRAAQDALNGPSPIGSDLLAEDCMSLLGAALLHTGLSTDMDELHRQCLVVKAAKVVSNPI